MVATSPNELSADAAAKSASNPVRDIAMIVAVIVAALTATIFGLTYRANELSNETAVWSERLDKTTLAGAASIGSLMENRSAALLELADNASLRLYLWALVSRGQIDTSVPAAEFDYLRSLLTANTDSGTRSALRGGGFDALALLDPELSTVLTTPGAATSEQALTIARQAIETRTRQLVLARDAGGNAVIYLAAMVEPPPGAAGGGAIGGVLLASVRADGLLRPLITRLPGYFDNDVNLLLASGGDPVVALTGQAPLTELGENLTLGFALTRAGDDATVLQSAQRVPGTGWQLVRRIDADRALQTLNQRLLAYFTALGLSVFLLATLLYAWRERSIRVQERNTWLPVLANAQQQRGPATREEQMLNKLVASLVDIIDLHDPYSAFHSARLAELCRAIGVHMGLDQESLSNLVTAALLANVGKLSLPRELLTKRDELSEDEQELLHSHVEEGVEILRKLEFDDPVLSAIAQKQEHVDGSGYPHGLAEDKITLPGRILAVANAFIALVSPRAYRAAISQPAALRTIEEAVGTEYDRQAFEALRYVVESGEGLSDWEFMEQTGT